MVTVSEDIVKPAGKLKSFDVSLSLSISVNSVSRIKEKLKKNVGEGVTLRNSQPNSPAHPTTIADSPRPHNLRHT